MTNQTAIRVAKYTKGYQVKVLVRYPASEQRKIAPGKTKINSLALRRNGDLVAEMYLGESISKNPLFTVHPQAVRKGDVLDATWHDTLGYSGSASARAD